MKSLIVAAGAVLAREVASAELWSKGYMISRRKFGQIGLATAGAATVSSAVFGGSATMAEEKFEITKTAEEWKKLLTSEQYRVLRQHGTERAGSSPLDKVYQSGAYHCAACDLELYSSDTKFDSRTGWPSFYQPINNAIGQTTDYKLLYPRTEIHCRRCGGHLGHVFNDGPKPTGLRYCMNGVALNFKSDSGDTDKK